MTPEVGEPLDEIVMDLLAGRAFADDERLAGKCLELDFSIAAEPVAGRQDDENTLGPELPALAARPIRAAGYERDIEVMLSDRGDLVGGVAVDESEFDGRVLSAEGIDEIGQKSRRQRRENADPDVAVFATADRRRLGPREADLIERLAATLNELLSGIREGHAIGGADEKRRSQPFLKLADTATDRRFLNTQRRSSSPETSVVRCRNNILDVAHLNRQSATSTLWSCR